MSLKLLLVLLCLGYPKAFDFPQNLKEQTLFYPLGFQMISPRSTTLVSWEEFLSTSRLENLTAAYQFQNGEWLAWPAEYAESLSLQVLQTVRPDLGLFVSTSSPTTILSTADNYSRSPLTITSAGWHLIAPTILGELTPADFLLNSIASEHPPGVMDRIFVYRDNQWLRFVLNQAEAQSLSELRPHEAFFVYVRDLPGAVVDLEHPLVLKPVGQSQEAKVLDISVSENSELCLVSSAPQGSNVTIHFGFMTDSDTVIDWTDYPGLRPLDDNQNLGSGIGQVQSGSAPTTSACFSNTLNQRIVGHSATEIIARVIPSSEDGVGYGIQEQLVLQPASAFYPLPYAIKPIRSEFASLFTSQGVLLHGGVFDAFGSVKRQDRMQKLQVSSGRLDFLGHGADKSHHTLLLHGDQIYAVGGRSVTTSSHDAQILTARLPADSNTLTKFDVFAQLNTPVEHPQAWVTADQIVVYSSTRNNNSGLNKVQFVNLTTKIQSEREIATADTRYQAAACLCSDKVYIIGGKTSPAVSAREILVLQPDTAEIIERIILDEAIETGFGTNTPPAAACIGESIYFIGGTIPTHTLYKLDTIDHSFESFAIPETLRPVATSEIHLGPVTGPASLATELLIIHKAQESATSLALMQFVTSGGHFLRSKTTEENIQLEARGRKLQVSSDLTEPGSLQFSESETHPYILMEANTVGATVPAGASFTIQDALPSIPSNPYVRRLQGLNKGFVSSPSQRIAGSFQSHGVNSLGPVTALKNSRHAGGKLSDRPVSVRYGGQGIRTNQALRNQLQVLSLPVNWHKGPLFSNWNDLGGSFPFALPSPTSSSIFLDSSSGSVYIFADPSTSEQDSLLNYGAFLRVDLEAQPIALTPLNAAPVLRSHSSVGKLGDFLYFVGGTDSSNTLTSSYLRYHIPSDTFSDPVDLPLLRRRNSYVFTRGQTLVIWGGEFWPTGFSASARFASDVEVFDPSTHQIQSYSGPTLLASPFTASNTSLAFSEDDEKVYAYTNGYLISLCKLSFQQTLVAKSLPIVSSPGLVATSEGLLLFGEAQSLQNPSVAYAIVMQSSQPLPLKPISVTASSSVSDIKLDFNALEDLSLSDVTLHYSSGGATFTTLADFIMERVGDYYSIRIPKTTLPFFSSTGIFQLRRLDNSTLMQSDTMNLNFGTLQAACIAPQFSTPSGSTVSASDFFVEILNATASDQIHLVLERQLYHLSVNGSVARTQVVLRSGVNSGEVYANGCSHQVQWTLDDSNIFLSASMIETKNLSFSPSGPKDSYPTLRFESNVGLHGVPLSLYVTSDEGQICLDGSGAEFLYLNSDRRFHGRLCQDETNAARPCIASKGVFEVTLWDGKCRSGNFAGRGRFRVIPTVVGKSQQIPLDPVYVEVSY